MDFFFLPSCHCSTAGALPAGVRLWFYFRLVINIWIVSRCRCHFQFLEVFSAVEKQLFPDRSHLESPQWTKWFDLFLHIEQIWALGAKLIYLQLGQIIRIYDFSRVQLAASRCFSTLSLRPHRQNLIAFLHSNRLAAQRQVAFLLNWILLRWLHLNLPVFLITSHSPSINLWNINEKSLFSTFFLSYDSLQKTISFTLQRRLTFFNSFRRTRKSNWPAWPAAQDNCENLLEFWKRKMKEIGVPTLPAYWHPDLVFKNPF